MFAGEPGKVWSTNQPISFPFLPSFIRLVKTSTNPNLERRQIFGRNQYGRAGAVLARAMHLPQSYAEVMDGALTTELDYCSPPMIYITFSAQRLVPILQTCSGLSL